MSIILAKDVKVGDTLIVGGAKCKIQSIIKLRDPDLVKWELTYNLRCKGFERHIHYTSTRNEYIKVDVRSKKLRDDIRKDLLK